MTHLQFLVLGPLLAAEQPGRALRRELAHHGVRRSGPAFYQMMGRLEDAGWVDGSYTQKIVDSQIIKERRYRITTAGARAWTETRTFYEEASRFADRAALVHG
jgi:DNA-binding PadR family transcriptional regulator